MRAFLEFLGYIVFMLVLAGLIAVVAIAVAFGAGVVAHVLFDAISEGWNWL